MNPNATTTRDEDPDTNDDSDDEYSEIFESIKTKTGLEIGCNVKWPFQGGGQRSHTSCHDDKDAACTEMMYHELSLSTRLPQECIAPMFDGTQWAGTRVWRAAVVALQYLLGWNDDDDDDTGAAAVRRSVEQEEEEEDRPPPRITRNTTVLELGCGLGVPGLILHAHFGCSTILTDKDDLVEQLRENIRTNFPNNDNDSKGMIQAQPLDWSVSGVESLLSQVQWPYFDIVLNCDCIYEPLYGQSWRLLLAVQEELLRRNSCTVVLTCCERRRADGVDGYLEAAQSSRHIARVQRIALPFAHSSNIELYRLHGVREDISEKSTNKFLH
jgi:Lysine methyltransferase